MPMIRPFDAWTLRCLLCGQTLNGEVEAVSGPLRPLADLLVRLPTDVRQTALDGFLCRCGGADRDALVKALADADPTGPSPEAEPARPYATLADIARIVSAQPWLWPGWIASGVLNAVAAEPGVGKTRFALDLALRLWFQRQWPDGQVNTWPEGTRTLWIQGDRNFAEMLQAARDFGLPEDAVALGSTPDDPTGGLDLDDEDTLARLAGLIEAADPALVMIDTVGMVTDRNLCRPEEARAFFAPLMELAGKTGVAFLGLTHLSKEKEALGRRIVEKARVVIKMTQPDLEVQPDRRRLWVDKSAVVKPPALGITMKADGNDYDLSPPADPESRKPGRPPAARDNAKRFVRDSLAHENDKIGNDLATAWQKEGGSKKTFWRAVDEMEEDGALVKDGGPNTGRQVVLHLFHPELETDPNRPS
jgi:hypothetical protein